MNQAQREPDYRAVFRDGSLTLFAHEPWMPRAQGHARFALRHHTQAVIADFDLIRGHDGLELVVEEITEPGNRSSVTR